MPYKTQSEDTPEVFERLQFEHLRRLGRKKRFEKGLARVDESLEMMWRAFRRRHPDVTPAELHVHWVRVQFGDDLAERIKRFLECQTQAPANIETPFGVP